MRHVTTVALAAAFSSLPPYQARAAERPPPRPEPKDNQEIKDPPPPKKTPGSKRADPEACYLQDLDRTARARCFLSRLLPWSSGWGKLL